MDRKEFENRLNSMYGFLSDCEKTAKEIVNRHGGSVDVETLMESDSYYFIDKEVGAEFKKVRIEEGEIAIDIETDYGEIETVGFSEATWDFIMLSDLMSALYEADGQHLDGEENGENER